MEILGHLLYWQFYEEPDGKVRITGQWHPMGPIFTDIIQSYVSCQEGELRYILCRVSDGYVKLFPEDRITLK